VRPKPSAVRNEPAAAPVPPPRRDDSPPRREEPRSASRRRDDDDYDDDRPRRRPKKQSSSAPILLIGGIALALVIGIAGAAVAIIAFSGKDKQPVAQTFPSNPVPPGNVASNVPNPRAPSGPPLGAPVGTAMAPGGVPSVGPAVGPTTKPPSTSTPPKTDTPPDSNPPPAGPASSTSVSDIYDYVLKSTVWILNLMPGGRVAGGTGSVIDANERLILTNYHVVANMQELVVFFPIYESGKPVAERERYMKILQERTKSPEDLLRAELIASDPHRDVAS